MNFHNYELNLPSYSVGEDVYKEIPKKCSPHGRKIVVIGGQRGINAAKTKIESALQNTDFEIISYLLFGTDCTYETVEHLKTVEAVENADMVFAVGGGKALDTVKCLCTMIEKPFFTFPTIASNCAAVTTVSIMYTEDGVFLKPHFFLKPANHAFIDTEIIANAPAKYMWAGIGDTYAKYYEATISSRGESLPHFTALGVTLSRQCLDPLLEYGKKAYEDNKKQICSDELEQVVLAIVVTTGIVSIFLTRDFTPDYNSGLAHAVFYALTSYPIIEEKHLHGEVVGFGVLIALLCDGQEEEFKKIYQLNQEIDLPVKLEDIEITIEQFEEVKNRIPEMSDVKHYPYKITKEMLDNVMKKLEMHYMNTGKAEGRIGY